MHTCDVPSFTPIVAAVKMTMMAKQPSSRSNTKWNQMPPVSFFRTYMYMMRYFQATNHVQKYMNARAGISGDTCDQLVDTC
jgi:hypothetical protein